MKIQSFYNYIFENFSEDKVYNFNSKIYNELLDS